jgi:hypothetical protein
MKEVDSGILWFCKMFSYNRYFCLTRVDPLLSKLQDVKEVEAILELLDVASYHPKMVPLF